MSNKYSIQNIKASILAVKDFDCVNTDRELQDILNKVIAQLQRPKQAPQKLLKHQPTGKYHMLEIHYKKNAVPVGNVVDTTGRFTKSWINNDTEIWLDGVKVTVDKLNGWFDE